VNLLCLPAINACVDAAEACLKQGGAAALRLDLDAFARTNFEAIVEPDINLTELGRPLTPPIVDAATQNELFALSRRAIEIFDHLLLQRYGCDLRTFARSLNWTETMMRTLEADAFSNRLALKVARPDIIMHAGKPYLVELNVDCAVGGKTKGSRALETAIKLPHIAEAARRFPLSIRSPIDALRRLIVEAARERGVAGRIRVAILDYASEAYLRRFEARLLTDDTVDARFVAIDQVAMKTNPPFHGYDIILKCCEISDELMHLSKSTIDSFIELFSDPSVLVLSNGHSTLVSNKLVYGVLVDQLENDGEALNFFERYIPWSRRVQPGRVTFHGEEVDMLDLLQTSRRQCFVLKKGFGWGGTAVKWGGRCTEQEWVHSVEHALSSRHYLLQEYLRPDTIDMPFLSDLDTIEWRRVSVLLGPYVFGSAPGGCQYMLTQDVQAGMIGPLYRSASYASFTV
jgi:hypothetical protein